MSLVDELIKIGIEQAERGEWVDVMADRVAELAEANLDGGWAAAADAAVATIRANKSKVAHLGAGGLVALTGTYWVHGNAEARASYLLQHGKIEDVFAAQDAAHAATLLEAQESTWDDIADVCQALLPVLPKVLPFLLAAI